MPTIDKKKNFDTSKYDFACSLGGNCAAAHNLLYRKLRFCSLPFDWVYIKDEKPLNMLIDGFPSKFDKFLLKENLVKLADNPTHPEKVQYLDSYSGYIFANHFTKTVENGGFDTVKMTFERRCCRLINMVKYAKKILFILSSSFELDCHAVFSLNTFLSKMYPNKKIDFQIIMFNCKSDTFENFGNITIRKFRRAENENDYITTNEEWNFLDNIKVSKIFKYKLLGKIWIDNFLLMLRKIKGK